MALTLDIIRSGDVAVVQCSGRIVFGKEADELRRVILGLLNETGRIVLNLASIAYIDSTGLEILVASFISAHNRKAEIKVAAIPTSVQRVLTLTRLDHLLAAYDSTDDAVKAFRPQPEATAS